MAERVQALIDQRAIEANCARLRRDLRAGTVLCAVVKGNGYGHGMRLVAEAAVRGGAGRLAVATACATDD